MNFGEKLQQLRKEHNLTQEQLAEKLYVTRPAVSKWENGYGYPSLDTLVAIAKLFSVTVDSLLSCDEIITVAKEETNDKVNSLTAKVFGIIDFISLLLIFLPMYSINGDNLINTLDSPFWFKIVIYCLIGLSMLTSILTFVFLIKKANAKLKNLYVLSVVIYILITLLFIANRQPYASTLMLFLLILMIVMLFSNIKNINNFKR